MCDNPFADGIALSGVIDIPDSVPASSVVEMNDVTMHDSLFGGITLYGQIAPSLVASNKIAGTGAYAIDISPFFGDEVADAFVFRGNNISGFLATIADVFLDYTARDTVLVGNSGTVVDNGINNRITGFMPMRGGAGGAIAAAAQKKRQFLQTLQALMSTDDGN